jgi:hypothetical protein
VCIGVLTYLPDTEAIVGEFCRVVGPGGSIIFTQRSDLWAERRCSEVLEGLVAAGVCEVVSVSEPGDYLPGHETEGHLKALLVQLRSLSPQG